MNKSTRDNIWFACATKVQGRVNALRAACCTRDGGWSPGAAVQAEASNHPLLLRLRGVVVSELGKGRARPCQVRAVESNVSESLKTCRKYKDGVKTGVGEQSRDQSEGYLFTARSASGMEATRTRSGLLYGTWEPVMPMPRESREWKHHEWQSTDAAYRDGAVRISAEGPVMGLERRDCLNRLGSREQPQSGGLP